MVQDDLSRDGVVSHFPQRPDTRFPAVSVVRAYWEALRNGRDVPFRSEIDPRGIESALEHTFILERIAPRLARFRLAGTHLNDLIGMEVRGMPLTSFFVPSARSEVEAVLSRVFDGPETAELTMAGETGAGRAGMEGRMILLPLRSDLGDVSRVLGCLVGLGPIGRTPQRFGIAGARVAPTIGGARGNPGHPAIPPMTRGFAEDVRPFVRPGNVAHARRPALRLVVSDGE
ncbi:MAG TPA: PAS domain-containing protein [Albidovulum sp.]|uniref:PAS domain-containing protein n=1 Tax=Albidovulum sp. TaxID=1872424 RepID=UPI002C7E357A|nr:PAS domain-containing protein [Albidovulum sp.]